MNVAALSTRVRRLPPPVVDVALALAVGVAITIGINVAREPGSQRPDLLAYALGWAIAAQLVARRRWPVAVLIASFVTLQAYYILGYPGVSPAVPLAVALYTAAASGHLGWSLGVAAWYVVGGLAFGVLLGPGPLVPGLNELVQDASLMTAVLLFGDAVRSRRELMSETQERLRRAEEDREREVQERRAARLIQLQLLPKELPQPPGWQISMYYQPARDVGGDFYDLLGLPDDQVAVIVGDVSGKGIPAALVMATTHRMLRGDAPTLSPGAVLQRANERLYSDIPAQMFATCLYAVLDPASGHLRYANAGHNLPYLSNAGGVTELRATGMPLGLMPGMQYEESEAFVARDDTMLLHSDGLVEAHSPTGEMFGFPRLRKLVEHASGKGALIDECLAELRRFTGDDWEQEDDITLVTLRRTSS